MRLRQFVISLPGIFDASLPIAGSRAGATGILDLTFADSVAQVSKSIDRMLFCLSEDFGFLLPSKIDEIAEYTRQAIEAKFLAVETNKKSFTILLQLDLQLDNGSNAAKAKSLKAALKYWRKYTNNIGVVVTSLDEAKLAEATGVNFVIAKGSDAGGLIGEETSFVLLQRLIAAIELPIVVWGGISWNTAVACAVGGAWGVMLDWQLSLLRESPLRSSLKRYIQGLDGSETETVKLSANTAGNGQSPKQWRALKISASTTFAEFERAFIEGAAARSESPKQKFKPQESSWQNWVAHRQSAHCQSQATLSTQLISIGQDAVFAQQWGKRFQTVSQSLAYLATYVEAQLAVVGNNLLQENSPLALSHGTRYPIVQGPMTRVSDVPEFCFAVAEGGALPFLALALITGQSLQKMLADTRELMGDRPWGVGILGFNEAELYREQFAAVAATKPPFAIISGGRVDQALSLEELGTTTYLHAPSPAILSIYLEEGGTNFVFEGRECGGHVGPRTSFVLWESMIQTLLTANLTAEQYSAIKILFAGGIHDALSAAMVSSLAQPLAARGIQVGILMGTAYIFTREAVETGAIIENFQQVARFSAYTVVAETGGGHAIRCAPTLYYDEFEKEKSRLKAEGLNAQAIRKILDESNIGRLRVASKGVERITTEGGTDGKQSVLASVDATRQLQDGIYMIGQVTALREQIVSIEELHQQVCQGATDHLEKFVAQKITAELADPAIVATPQPLDIAIVGIACLLPGGANNAETYWENILHSRDAIQEVPKDRFDVDTWFDTDRQAKDKIYGRWGGFVDDITFDPLKYGIPPASIPQIEPMQLIALELTEQALRDAGILQQNPYKERTGIVLGIGGGASELGSNYIVRSTLPRFIEQSKEQSDATLMTELMAEFPQWTEDSFAGILLNVVTGRVSNRFDFGGANFTVDAACASSLAAVYLACKELISGASDVMIAGGCDTTQNPFGYLCFAKTGALSPTGRSKTFDTNSDGIVISEGHAAVVLKRLKDAERDGDRIYGVIKATASGSDGKSMGLTAPREDGQLRTLRRAYAQAGYTPDTVSLYEAHGTGTVVGDRTEALALSRLLKEHNAPSQSIAIGSVKSMIGHTKCAAGIAGLIKSTLALHHRVLPPTMHVKAPNPDAGLVDGPLYVNSELRPWVAGELPRRASVSAFGFGGTNFHVALEEYTAAAKTNEELLLHRQLAAELFVFTADSVPQLQLRIKQFATDLQTVSQADDKQQKVSLADLAYGWFLQNERAKGKVKAAIVAVSTAGLLEQLANLQAAQLENVATNGATQTSLAKQGIYLMLDLPSESPEVCFLFPGQGSQYLNMQRDLALEFQELLQSLNCADAVLHDVYEGVLSRKIFPKPMFNEDDRQQAREILKTTDVTQPALGVSSVGMLHLLRSFGVVPQQVAGHSYGELVALYAAGVFDEATLYRLSWERGNAIMQMTRQGDTVDLGGMLATNADEAKISSLIAEIADCWVANLNSPKQTILSGTENGIAKATSTLTDAGITNIRIPVSCAFHSPIMAGAKESFGRVLQNIDFNQPSIPVYSNATAEVYPTERAKFAALLQEQLTQPVRFQTQIENLYANDARVFVEVGPGNVLTKLVGQILADKPHTAINTNAEASHAVVQFIKSLGQLITKGVAVDCERLYVGRRLEPINLGQLAKQKIVPPAAHLWKLNGSYARPIQQAPRGLSRKFVLSTKESSGANMKDPIHQAAPQAVPSSTVQQLNVNPNVTVPHAPMFAPVLNQRPVGMSPITAHNGDAKSQAMVRFQQTMSKFLETQQQVMTAFLTGSAPVQQTQTINHGYLPNPVVYQPTPTQPLVPLQPAPFVNPIYSAGSAAQAATHAVFTRNKDSVLMSEKIVSEKTVPAKSLDLKQILIELIANKTGYPAEILDTHANLEADLGIDSIKRVEIVAAFRKAVLPAMDKPSQAFMEQMSAVQTIDDILNVIKKFVPADQHSSSTVDITADDLVENTAVPQDLTALLVDLIAARTGYPPEILNSDANLEAELGIDSIKRVEIIAAFRKQVLPGMDKPSQAFMESMSAVQTIQDIINVVEAFTSGNETSKTHPKIPTIAAALTTPLPNVTLTQSKNTVTPRTGKLFAVEEAEECPRSVVRVVKTNSSIDADWLLPRGIYILTADNAGVAAALQAKLLPLGGHAVVIPAAELRDPASVAQAVADIRQQVGPIAGLIHLLPIDEAVAFPAIDQAACLTQIERDLNSLLYLLQALDPELESDQPAFSVLCATVGAGDFNQQVPNQQVPNQQVPNQQVPNQQATNKDLGECLYPWRGGIAGLIKCAAKEWPSSQFQVVDFQQLPSAEQVFAELAMVGKGAIEIGYRDGERLALMPVVEQLNIQENSLQKKTAITPPLTAKDLVLVTGGARGITAEIAKEFAAASGATMVLVGRSAEPKTEDPSTANFADTTQLRKVLVDKIKASGKIPQPREIEKQLKSLLANREILQTLADIREVGADVEYHSCDVANPQELTAIVSDVQKRRGAITGLIHGAGIIEDRYIIDKTVESFQRVIATKISPLLTLTKLLEPEKLKLCLLFSSTAGFFGNPGQGDYAAANEMLNRFARRLQQIWPTKVAALNWGPWCGAGMVTSEVEEQFRSRGVGMVTLQGGRQAAWRESLTAHDAPVRLLMGPGSWVEVTEGSELLRTELPLLRDQAVYRLADGSVMAQIVLDERSHLYLTDHTINENPVLPLAVAMELMAETVSLANPDWFVTHIENLRLLKGVVISAGYREVVIRTEHLTQEDTRAQWRVSIADPVQKARPFYDAIVTLESAALSVPVWSDLNEAERIPTLNHKFPKAVKDAYQQWLFHGPAYHSIERFEGFDRMGIDASVLTSSAGFLPNANWIVNPLVLDTAPQMAILWSRATYDSTPLPNAIHTYTCYAPIKEGRVHIVMRFDHSSSDESYKATAWFLENDQVVGKLEGLEGYGSKALNRLNWVSV